MYNIQVDAECICLWARNLIRNAEKQIRWHCLCGGGNEDSVCCAKAAAILGPQD